MQAPFTFPAATCESLGIPTAALMTFLDAVDNRMLGLHNFQLIRHGQQAAYGAWAPYQRGWPHTMFSLTKSFTSTAMGMAVSDGLLTVDDLVSDYIGTPSGPYGADMRIRHLLSMSTGHEFDVTPALDVQADGDWVRAFLDAPVTQPPGSLFVYNSAASHMLSVIAEKAFGKPIEKVLQERLFAPLDFSNRQWEADPKGHNTGGWGLHLRTQDIAKFGQMLLQKGMWRGMRILPEAWVTEASAKHVQQPEPAPTDWLQGYGYQFWRCQHNVFRGDGAFGQYCIVMPDQDAVLAITSGTTDMQAILDCVWEILLPAMGEALPDNPQAQRKLALRLNMLSLPKPAHDGQLWPEGTFTGDNMTATFAPGWLTVQRGDHATKVAVNLQQWVAGWTELGWLRLDDKDRVSILSPEEMQRTAACAGWQGDALVVKAYMTETPFAWEWRFAFDKERKTAVLHHDPGLNMAGLMPGEWRVTRVEE